MSSDSHSDQQSTSLNAGTILLGFAAVLLGLGATYAVRVLTNRPAPAEPAPVAVAKPKLVTVPLASRDIAAGTTLTIDDVALYKMSPEEVKEHCGNRSFMTNPSQIVGKISAKQIERGDTFTTEDFYAAGQRPHFADRLKPGLRAVTIKLTPDDALGGFASPGQSVDVLFHYDASQATHGSATYGAGGASQSGHGVAFGHHDFNPPRRRDYYGNTIGGTGGSTLAESLGSDAQEATTTLVQAVEVLAIGSEAVPTDTAVTLPDTESITVTLAVTPRQAELLSVARGHGRLSLTLRSTDDTQFVKLVDPVTIDQIIKAEHSVHEMEIYRGKQLTRLQFEEGKFLQRRVFDESPIAAAPPSHVDGLPFYPPVPGMPMGTPTFVPFWLPPASVTNSPSPFANSSAAPSPGDKPPNATSPETETAPVTLYDKVLP